MPQKWGGWGGGTTWRRGLKIGSLEWENQIHDKLHCKKRTEKRQWLKRDERHIPTNTGGITNIKQEKESHT